MSLSPWRSGTVALCSAVFALPLLAAMALGLQQAMQAQAWAAVLGTPAFAKGLALSLWVAVASTLASLLLTVALATAWQGRPAWARATRALSAMLAVPHAAFAIGLAWLLAPSGWVARLLAPLFGWASPPPWETVNDPHGLALIAALVLKETPFLLWSLAALLARPERAAALQRQQAVARTLGYTVPAWWLKLGWAQHLPLLAWPVAAVLAYGLTVVDMALVLGPQSPPTLAVQAYAALMDGSVQRNAEGAVLGLVLLLALAALGLLAVGLHRLLQASLRQRCAEGVRTSPLAKALRWLTPFAAGLAGAYPAVLLALALWSVAGPWGFPALWPEGWAPGTWAQVGQSFGVVGFSLGLALVVAAASVVLAVAWLEAAPPSWDARITPLVLAPLVLPQLLWLVGLYELALHARLDGTVPGLAWAHGLLVLPYVLTALQPAWRSFDVRYEHTALGLGRSRLAFWWRVKWPLLAAPLASALAVGFAVALAQYLSTQFIGAARHPTLTTEAVTLASGGQRNLGAAYALLQAVLPMAGFALAAAVARRSMHSHGAA